MEICIATQVPLTLYFSSGFWSEVVYHSDKYLDKWQLQNIQI